ncbi:MAG: thioredoxin family protein [Puia sp.]|nr:thioredoxin family protein [Puia sp.]
MKTRKILVLFFVMLIVAALSPGSAIHAQAVSAAGGGGAGVPAAGESKPYDPLADAGADIAAALKRAKAENKHVLLQAGGNWCGWCMEFNRFVHATGQIDSLIEKCFVVYHLNYSKENTNNAIFARYGYPQRFGFPVFVILDAEGARIHTQNSEYLEQGRSYNKQRVYEFLIQWTPQALNPALYK